MRIEEVCSVFTDGDWIESKDQSEGGIRLVQTGNIGIGCFVEKAGKEKYISEDTFNRLNCSEVFPGDVLISRLPDPVGRGCIIPVKDERMITAVDCTICRINKDIVDDRFFCYYLRSPAYLNQLDQSVTGTTRKRISRKNLGQVEICVPDKDYQLFVVGVLDKLTAIIANRQKELQHLDNLIKARFVEMFGDPDSNTRYPQVAIKELTDVVSGGTPDRKNNMYWENGTIPWVKTTELQNNRLTAVEEYITERGLNESSAKIVPKDTVLIAMYGQGKTRGMTGFLDIAAATNQACACLLPSEKIEAEYLWQYMIMSYDKLRNLAQGGNQPNLNGNMIKGFTVLVPPKKMQISFVNFVKQVDKSKAQVQKALDEIQLLFDSLMQEYFG